ncbi:MAG: hypothetical protein K6G18_17080 [Treponema sp.]|nr:hypothetical protein [Treponema sp.]
MEMDGIQIVHTPTEAEPFLIVDKPSGLPSAPLREGDDSALTRLLPRFPAIAGVRGRKPVEGGLVHRLDTQTSGLLLMATSQSFYEQILAEQDAGRFVKRYSAECDAAVGELPGFPPCPLKSRIPASGASAFECTLQSRFRPWGPHAGQVRPVVEGAGPAAVKKASPGVYQTDVRLEFHGTACRASCRIVRGYRHQVRCHLAWLGFPVIGDPLYNPLANLEDPFCFRATGLEFLHLSFALN